MKILVVEDDRKVAGFIEQGLREEGYAVDVAPDGEEGTTLAHVYDYDLGVLDVMLPKKNGPQVATELRREGRKTPILMLTARDATEDVVRGLDAGADDYLPKPFKFDELLARVRALLRRGGESRPGAHANAAGRSEPHRAPELWPSRARPLEAEAENEGKETRAHAEGVPATR